VAADQPILRANNFNTVTWFRDGVSIPGVNNSQFTVTEPGTYTAAAIADDCQSQPSEPISFVVTSLENQSKSVSLYPNPSTNQITIDISSYNLETTVPFFICDILGKTVYEGDIRDKKVLDVTAFKVASYIITISTPATVTKLQFTKQ
jgi:hypothetical protein